jgi:hypothetical protein
MLLTSDKEKRHLYISVNKLIVTTVKYIRLRLVGHVANAEKTKNAYTILVGKPVGKQLLIRPKRRRNYNTKMCVRKYVVRSRWNCLRIVSNVELAVFKIWVLPPQS